MNNDAEYSGILGGRKASEASNDSLGPLCRNRSEALELRRKSLAFLRRNRSASQDWESDLPMDELFREEFGNLQKVMNDCLDRLQAAHTRHESKFVQLMIENQRLRAGGIGKNKSKRSDSATESLLSEVPILQANMAESNRSAGAPGLLGPVDAGPRNSGVAASRNSGVVGLLGHSPVMQLEQETSGTGTRSVMFNSPLREEDFDDGVETEGPDGPAGAPPDVNERAMVHIRSDTSNVELVSDNSSSESDESSSIFEVLPSWEKMHKMYLKNNDNSNKPRASYVRGLVFTYDDLLQDADDGASVPCLLIQRFCMPPNCVKRVTWDMLSILLVAYDLFFIPFQFFDPPENAFFLLIAWIARLFWTFDLAISFITGYTRSDGTVEMRIGKIAKRFLRSWFGLDIFLVMVDWLESSWQGFGFVRIGKASRVFRILRLVRLLRLFRIQAIIRVTAERIHSEKLTIVVDIFKIVAFVVVLAHLIACMWYGIGTADLESDEASWVREHIVPTATLFERYALSMHWGVSQFTGGMDEMRPHNLGERIFAVVIYVFAFIVASVFVSNLTSSMTRLHFIASNQLKQFLQLKRYLFQNGISEALMLRIQRNAQHAVLEQQFFMHESSVELLRLISDPLRIDLHFELYSPVLELHPFFMEYTKKCPHVMRKVCHCATSMSLVSTGDAIFDAGEIPANPKMYFVCGGMMQYVSITGGCSEVKPVQWVAEGTLWTHWMHMGVLTATTESKLVVIDSNRFQHIANQFDHVDFDPREYAVKFCNRLNESVEEITDLPLVDDSDEGGTPLRALTRRMTMTIVKPL